MDQESISKLNSLEVLLKQKLSERDVDLLSHYPCENTVALLDQLPRVSGYNYLGQKFIERCDRIGAGYGNRALTHYHQLMLVKLMQHSQDRLGRLKIDAHVNVLYEKNFKRIIRGLESSANNEQFYSISNDKYLKDLAVCAFRLIPTGVRKVHLARIPVRRLLKQNGWASNFSSAMYFIFILKGISPLYQGHLDSHDMDLLKEFNPAGWKRHYQIIAEILKLNKDVKGVMGISWFYDPQLKTISPELSYIREMVVKNGGKLFYMGQNEKTIKNALMYSPKRKKLFLEGTYVPKNYMSLWPRKELLEWNKKINN